MSLNPRGMARPNMFLDLENVVDPLQAQRDEMDRRYREIRADSGKITLMGTTHDVTARELQEKYYIGGGSYGQVVRYDFLGHPMAVKKMARTHNPEDDRRVIMELATISRTGDCPNIVSGYGYFILNTEVWVCMELLPTCLGNLLVNLNRQPFPEKIIAKMSVSIVDALNYLKQNHNVIHRDVKPSNILLDCSGTIKLCDFGISGILIESRAHSALGCTPYMSPERCDVEVGQNYDIRADVWSLGVTLYELAIGTNPYMQIDNEFAMLSTIIQSPPLALPEKEFSKEFCDFIFWCLQKEPIKRPKYDRLMPHPFLQNSREDTVTSVEDWFSSIFSIDL